MSIPTTGDGQPLRKGWENPFSEDTPLHGLFGRRIRNNQDLVFVLDDYHARRGTGKTVAAMQLANAMDQTDEGLTFEKCAIAPEEIREAYSNQPKRSGLVLDEAEVGVSNRRAMSNANEALRQIMSMGRIEEKYVCVNSPSKDFIDKDILQLADVWITMLTKGVGLVHYLERNPYSGALMTPKKQLIEFEDIAANTELRSVYNQLTEEKKSRIAGDEGDGFVKRDEVEKAVEKAEKEASREKRNEIVKELYNDPELELSQPAIAKAVDLSQAAVSQIVNDV